MGQERRVSPDLEAIQQLMADVEDLRAFVGDYATDLVNRLQELDRPMTGKLISFAVDMFVFKLGEYHAMLARRAPDNTTPSAQWTTNDLRHSATSNT